jgi:hypothetical protein
MESEYGRNTVLYWKNPAKQQAYQYKSIFQENDQSTRNGTILESMAVQTKMT